MDAIPMSVASRWEEVNFKFFEAKQALRTASWQAFGSLRRGYLLWSVCICADSLGCWILPLSMPQL